jgi:hypothetical protein
MEMRPCNVRDPSAGSYRALVEKTRPALTNEAVKERLLDNKLPTEWQAKPVKMYFDLLPRDVMLSLLQYPAVELEKMTSEELEARDGVRKTRRKVSPVRQIAQLSPSTLDICQT